MKNEAEWVAAGEKDSETGSFGTEQKASSVWEQFSFID
jgi:hypothetical protein